MNVFKRVESNNGALKFNYRPAQDIGDRIVHHRLEGYSGASTLAASVIPSILGILLIRLLQTANR